MPMREIRKKYTISDLVLMSWDSKQKSYNMRKRFHKGSDSEVGTVKDVGEAWQLPEGVNNNVAIPKKFFNDEGELDLRLATGEEACAYLRKLGISIMPVIRT